MRIHKRVASGLCALCLAALTGCESTSDHKGAIVGGVGGAAVGATAGALIGGKEHRTSGAIIGGAVGAAAGAVAGDQIYDKEKRQEEADKASQTQPQAPK